MKKDQGHGDHLGAIMPAEKLLSDHLRDIINKSKVTQHFTATIAYEHDEGEERKIFALDNDESPIKWRIFLVCLPQSNDIVTFFPVLPAHSQTRVTISEVQEWANLIEATVTGETEDGAHISFFATDYAYRKDRYAVGQTVNVGLAAMVYFIEEAEHSFQFEGQQAIDFLAKMGESPTYDGEGKVQPVLFSLEKLVALLPRDPDYPDEYEFQTPSGPLAHHQVLGVEMTSTDVLIHQEPDIHATLYFRSDKLADVPQDTPLRDTLWMQGELGDN